MNRQKESRSEDKKKGVKGAWSAALGPIEFPLKIMIQKLLPFRGGVSESMALQMPLVEAFITEFMQHQPKQSSNFFQGPHISSISSRVGTKGVSLDWITRPPRQIPCHTLSESIRIVLTKTRKMAQSKASNSALKI